MNFYKHPPDDSDANPLGNAYLMAKVGPRKVSQFTAWLPKLGMFSYGLVPEVCCSRHSIVIRKATISECYQENHSYWRCTDQDLAPGRKGLE